MSKLDERPRGMFSLDDLMYDVVMQESNEMYDWGDASLC